MATIERYSRTADGYIECTDATWQDVLDNNSPSSITAYTGVAPKLGTIFGYSQYQTFLSFDTSAIPETDTVTNASLQLQTNSTAANPKEIPSVFQASVTGYNWTEPLTTSDYRTRTQLQVFSPSDLIAMLPYPIWNDGSGDYYIAPFTISPNDIVKGDNGITRIILWNVAAEEPDNDGIPGWGQDLAEKCTMTAGDGISVGAKLTVTYETPAASSSGNNMFMGANF